jgi:hypothetical protein
LVVVVICLLVLCVVWLLLLDGNFGLRKPIACLLNELVRSPVFWTVFRCRTLILKESHGAVLLGGNNGLPEP